MEYIKTRDVVKRVRVGAAAAAVSMISNDVYGNGYGNDDYVVSDTP